MMSLVDISKVAQALNLEVRRVQQLVKEGMPREARGQYDAVKCMLFYIRYLQGALEKKAVPTLDGGFVGEREERIRLLRADADLREIKLAKERGLLVAIDDVEREMTNLVLVTKARIMAVAPRLAPDLLGETSCAMLHAKIEKALKEALVLLSRREGRSDAEGGSQNTEAADCADVSTRPQELSQREKKS
jgi:phage terminase Nu1 subunit (DNA packaging protein)